MKPSGPDPELKFSDFGSNSVLLTNSGSTITLNDPIQGTAVTQRIGQKITVKRVAVRGYVYNTVAQLNTANFLGGSDVVRVAIVYDKQSNGTSASYNDVYNIGAGSSQTPISERSRDTLDRYVILAERTLVLCATANTMVTFDFEIPVDLETRYNSGNSGTVTDINMGAISLLLADFNGVASNFTTMVYQSRIAFTDE